MWQACILQYQKQHIWCEQRDLAHTNKEIKESSLRNFFKKALYTDKILKSLLQKEIHMSMMTLPLPMRLEWKPSSHQSRFVYALSLEIWPPKHEFHSSELLTVVQAYDSRIEAPLYPLAVHTQSSAKRKCVCLLVKFSHAKNALTSCPQHIHNCLCQEYMHGCVC